MWVVYDEYTGYSSEDLRFGSVCEAGDFIEASEDPLTWRIRYED